MLEFKIIETLKPNNEILEAIKDYTYKVKKEKIKYILHTNLQVSNKPFFIKEHNQKYNLKEISKIHK